MSYIKKNLKLTKTLTQNNKTYKSFTISDLPSYFEKIPMSETFNNKGLTYINTNFIK